MKALTPKLRDKLMRFHQAYEAALARLIGAGPSNEVTDDEAWDEAAAAQAWEEARLASPLTREELRVYKLHVAIHLLNGGAVFPAVDAEVPELPNAPGGPGRADHNQ